MEFNPQAVEIFSSDFSSTLGYVADFTGQLKCRLYVGYVIGSRLYHMHKMGAVHPLIAGEPDPADKLIEAARLSYWRISNQGKVRIPVFAYDLGVPVEFDDDGEPIGEWPQIGELVLTYSEKFLMPGGQLPEDYRHLRPVQLGW